MAEIQNTERLPFPLSKPNEDTFVTKTSEIGHNGSPLSDVLTQQDAKIGKSAKTQESEDGGSLDISDENGNVIMRLEGGNLKTKNFDSDATPSQDYCDDDGDSDMNIADPNGNVIAQFKEGHFRTKKFDSRDSNDAGCEVMESASTAQLSITDAQGNVILELKNGGIKTEKFDSTASVSGGAYVSDINLVMPNLRNKLAALEREENVQCIIGLIGDSWTQHHNCDSTIDPSSGLNHHSNYVQPLAKYLREKYGNAGGGFYSFSMSHNGVAKMMSVDFDDAQDTRSTTSSELITYRDQINDCRWVDAADATFHAGAQLTLNVKTNHDKLVIHYYGESSGGVFSYALDGGNAVSVDSSLTEGHQTIEIPCSDTPHTLVFNQISGSTMIFGVDMQRTSRGVRVHKFGNKGATANSFVIVDTDCWIDAIESFNLDTATILFGTNDGPANIATAPNIGTIIDNIRSVNEFCDICIICPSDNITTGTGGRDMTNQSIWQHDEAISKKCGYINLRPLFGSCAQIAAKGTFVSDGTHPTWASGRMIADYLIEKLI